jgi:hypothetical protein
MDVVDSVQDEKLKKRDIVDDVVDFAAGVANGGNQVSGNNNNVDMNGGNNNVIVSGDNNNVEDGDSAGVANRPALVRPDVTAEKRSNEQKRGASVQMCCKYLIPRVERMEEVVGNWIILLT